MASAQSIFFVGNLQCLLEDLHFHGLLTQDPFQFPHAVLELLGFGGSHDRFVGLQGRHPPSLTSFRHRKRRLGAMPFCRATKDTLIPGRSGSSTIRIFSDTDHRRRCWTVATISTASLSLALPLDIGIYGPRLSARGQSLRWTIDAVIYSASWWKISFLLFRALMKHAHALLITSAAPYKAALYLFRY